MPEAHLQQTDDDFMRRAMALAILGRGAVEPNPMVGCVIAREGRVIGEGYHRKFGQPHAEAEALAACSESPAGGTAYVTLEPCCHTAKKTPPCVPRLIEARLARVVVGCLDPNPQVSGRGVGQLRAAGIRVDLSPLEPQAKQLNAPFFARLRLGRPYVTLKWAESANGKVAGPPGERLWISDKASQRVVHALRARCDAILVGINTVMCDDPMLTVRGVEPLRSLLRVVLDRTLRIPVNSRLVRSANQSPLLVVCSEPAPDRAAPLRDHGVDVVAVPGGTDGRLDLGAILQTLGSRGATHVLVEPGPNLAKGFFESGLADRVWVFRSPDRVEAPGAADAVEVGYPIVAETQLAADRLAEYLNPASPAYFAPIPSADFQLLESQ